MVFEELDVGFPQVGTRHVLRIRAILKSLRSVSRLPSEARAFVYLMVVFFFPLRISCRRSGACLPLGPHKNYQSVVVGLSDTLLGGEVIFKKLHLKT